MSSHNEQQLKEDLEKEYLISQMLRKEWYLQNP